MPQQHTAGRVKKRHLERLEFDLNRSIDAAALDVQSAISVAASRLPIDLPAPPAYRKVNPADTPVIFLALTSELEELTRHNRELLTRGYHATRELLAAITDGPAAGGYSAAGSSTSFGPPPSTIDRVV